MEFLNYFAKKTTCLNKFGKSFFLVGSGETLENG